MNKSILYLWAILITMSFPTHAHELTLYLIRHAQAQKDGTKNPMLSEKGSSQAEAWSEVFKDVKFDKVYSSNYNRTQFTAKAIADSKNLNVISYDAKTFNINDILKSEMQGKVLIVGHSNTIPEYVNALIKRNQYPWFGHHEHGTLFIVKLNGSYVSEEKLKIFD